MSLKVTMANGTESMIQVNQFACWMTSHFTPEGMLQERVAYVSGDEDKLGSIEEGKLADFAILDGDYLNVPEEQISDIPVVMTVVGGQVMYEAN